ncbi:hypothetical protein BDQ94DRAFT_145274 [Aspergillus welwitschiae]|uniref:Uncharacterized protein n=1 Tax=Aspergillus welwitschiae TaxID=1341132 RepID=A0A3F3Q055_9EURO|nr:hypothetical protein BDQ94DRAFT_145274 [Aspergillus welwitschiae]RDH32417.1 hypothetical protein BDQ94DRAFT_145274 [Aspergillus welwitschiae]
MLEVIVLMLQGILPTIWQFIGNVCAAKDHGLGCKYAGLLVSYGIWCSCVDAFSRHELLV